MNIYCADMMGDQRVRRPLLPLLDDIRPFQRLPRRLRRLGSKRNVLHYNESPDNMKVNLYRDEVIIRRAVEAEFGRVDPDEWALAPDDPVEWRDCLKVALHLTHRKSLSPLLLSVLKLSLVNEKFITKTFWKSILCSNRFNFCFGI